MTITAYMDEQAEQNAKRACERCAARLATHHVFSAPNWRDMVHEPTRVKACVGCAEESLVLLVASGFVFTCAPIRART